MAINQKFINAVFNLDIETFKTLLNTEPFDESLLKDINFSEDILCPIYWMTQCWEIIFEHPDEWSEQKRLIIEENKRRNLEIRRLFEEKFNIDFRPIDFYNSNFQFFRNYRDDNFDDVFDNKKEYMIANGYREIDLDLYVAVNKFDFEEAERLLKLGADPDCEFIEEDESSCLSRIGAERSFLSTQLEDIYIERKQRFLNADYEMDLVDLVGWAAHESMYSLLSKYKVQESDKIRE